MGIIYALLLFGLVVMFHELGHFLLAKKNGIEVSEFSIGMGPKLYGKEKNGTLYSLRLLPLGGYCAMGEDDKETGREGSFNSAPVSARIKVIAAGPVFNFIMAFVLSVIMVACVGYDSPVITDVVPGMPARAAGLKAGDTITKVGNRHVYLYREVPLYMMAHAGEKVQITVKRDGKTVQTHLTPAYDKKQGRYMIGIVRQAPMKKAGIGKAVVYGTCEVRYWILSVVDSLKMLIRGQVGADKLSGPVGIVGYMDKSYKATTDFGALAVLGMYINMAILLSANLGVMNLLPLPALDGGRLLFLIVEALAGKRVPPEKEGMVHFAGFILLMVIMGFVMINGFRRLF